MPSESASAGWAMSTMFLIGLVVTFLAPIAATIPFRIKYLLGLFLTCSLSTTGALIHAIGAWDLLAAFVAARGILCRIAVYGSADSLISFYKLFEPYSCRNASSPFLCHLLPFLQGTCSVLLEFGHTSLSIRRDFQ